MNLNLLLDYADNMVVEHPETIEQVLNDPTLFKGKGNLCAQLAILFSEMGISREDRLRFIAEAFQLRPIASMKELRVCQLTTLYIFRDCLKDFYAAQR